MAELLAIVTVREASLGFVRLYPDCSMGKASQFEYLVELSHLREGFRKRRMFTVVVPSEGDPTVVRHLFDPNNIKAKVHQFI
jgi:hypothetical protein